MPQASTEKSARQQALKQRLAGKAHRDVATAKAVRSRFGLPRHRFARIVDVSERSLADLEKGKKASAGVARRLNEARRLHEALSQVVSQESVAEWLDEPNDAFDGLKPIEVLERGESDRLWRMIFYLQAGVPY